MSTANEQSEDRAHLSSACFKLEEAADFLETASLAASSSQRDQVSLLIELDRQHSSDQESVTSWLTRLSLQI